MRLHRAHAVICALLAAAVFAGCGITRVYVSPPAPAAAAASVSPDADTSAERSDGLQSAAELPGKPSPVPSSGVYFSAEDTRAMSNCMLANTFAHKGKTLFGSKHDEEGNPYFCRMKYSETKDGMYVRETEVIETGVDVRYLVIRDGYLYAICEDIASGATSLIRLAADSGSSLKPEVLYSGTCDELFLHGDSLYFTDADAHLMSIGTDGTGLRQVLADKAICYPYLVSDDLLVFQDDAGGESLHVRDLSSGEEFRVAEGRVYGYIISGQYLYFSYVEDSDGMRSRLCRLDLNDALKSRSAVAPERSDRYMGTRFSINGDHINGSNYRTEKLENWRELEDDQYEAGYTSACQYVSENYEIFYDYNENGLIDKVLFYEPDVKRAGYFELADS